MWHILHAASLWHVLQSSVHTQLHSRVALDRRRCKWSDRGLSGADTSHRTNHLLLSSAALEQKKKKEDGKMSYKMCVCVGEWGGGFDEKLCGCRMQQLSYTWWQFWRDHSYVETWVVHFCFIRKPKDNSCSPARTNYVQGKKTTIKFKLTIFYRVTYIHI